MWAVPRCFEGRTVAVLASGPSMCLADAEALRAADVPCLVINSTFRLAPWAWALYAADAAWWTHEANRDALTFAGERVSVERVKGVRQLINTGTTGFDPDPGNLRTGGNSGYQAVHLMAHAGALRILLLGFDMGGDHWHPDHPAPLKKTEPEIYTRWIGRFQALADALAAREVEVINCTPDSALKCFPIMTLEDALAGSMSAA